MIKLKNILGEGYAWERQEGKPLPTLKDVQEAYKKSLKEAPRYYGDIDELYAEIAAYLADDGHAPSEEAALRALENSDEDYETLVGIYMSDHLTLDEKISMIADLIDIDRNDNDQRNMHEAAKPDYIDADGDGNEKESMKKAFADKKAGKEVNEEETEEESDHAADEEAADMDVLNMGSLEEGFWNRVKGNLHGHEYILREAFRK
jgi:hypothetical protein